MVNYDKALTTATKPDCILAQAFADFTGTPISVRFVQKLMKTHTNQIILCAMKRMGRKTVDAPYAYLAGICRNLSRESYKANQKKLNLANAVVRLEVEGDRENRPTLERPF